MKDILEAAWECLLKPCRLKGVGLQAALCALVAQSRAFVPLSPSRAGAGVRRHGLGSWRTARGACPVRPPVCFQRVRDEGSTLTGSQLELPKKHLSHEFITSSRTISLKKPAKPKTHSQPGNGSSTLQARKPSMARSSGLASVSLRFFGVGVVEHRGPKQMLALRVSALTSGALENTTWPN